ncbi:MAG: hypothetical protein ACOYN0_02020 [Phycisphaerales bacterium]
MNEHLRILAGLAIGASAFGFVPAANAQVTGRVSEKVAPVVTVRPELATLRKLQKPLTVTFTDNKLEDVLKFIADATGAEFEVMWIDDRQSEGLSKEMTLSMEAKGVTALTLLERVLEKATSDESASEGGNSWQMTTLGTVQVGPKSRLNKYRRVELYPIDDLLLEIPRFEDAPEFNLQTVLQSSQGGGGQSPFQDNNADNQGDQRTREEKTQEVIDLITQLVEPDQWADNSGDGGTIRAFQGSLIVNAPDYMHRELAGYPYWPNRGTSGGRASRYVGLSGGTSTSQVNQLNNSPVTEPK